MTRSTARWIPLLMAVAAAIAYANSLQAPFIFDDIGVIVENDGVQHFFPMRLTTRLLVDLSFRINYALGGLNPLGYRLVNIVIHALAGWCLFEILYRTLASPRLGGRYETSRVALAGVSALLWTVHPLQTESVTYVCQRYECMMGLFVLLTLYAFVRGQRSGASRAWMGASVAGCAVSMLMKPVSVCLPPLILAYDVLLVSGSWRETCRTRRRYYVGLFLTWGIFAAAWLAELALCLELGSEPVPAMSPWRYLGSQVGVIVHYVRLCFWPHPLCLDYAWPLASGVRTVLVPAVPVVAAGVATVCGLITRRPVAFLGVWFFCILAPTSSVWPVHDLAFEHRMYLPLAAILVGGVLCVSHGAVHIRRRGWVSDRWGRRVLVMATALVVVCATGATALRNSSYSSEEVMWTEIVACRPLNLRARNRLAAVLCEREAWAAARAHFDVVLSRTRHVVSAVETVRGQQPFAMATNSDESNRFTALANVGLMSAQQGRWEDAEAYYVAALRVYPYSDLVATRLAGVLARRGVPQDRIGDTMRRVVFMRVEADDDGNQ